MDETAVDEVTRAGILEAIRVLDALKMLVVHDNLDAWFVLYNAKCHLRRRFFD